MYKNGIRIAGAATQELHKNRSAEYCRIYCHQQDCTGCMGFYLRKKEVPVMSTEAVVKPKSSGFWNCPGCHQVIPAGDRDDHVANCEEYAMLTPDEQLAVQEQAPKAEPEAEEKTEAAPEPEAPAEEPEPAAESIPKDGPGKGRVVCGYEGCTAVFGNKARKRHMFEVHGIGEPPEQKPAKPEQTPEKPNKKPEILNKLAKKMNKRKETELPPDDAEFLNQMKQDFDEAVEMQNLFLRSAQERDKALQIILPMVAGTMDGVGQLTGALAELWDLRQKVRKLEHELEELREKRVKEQ